MSGPSQVNANINILKFINKMTLFIHTFDLEITTLGIPASSAISIPNDDLVCPG